MESNVEFSVVARVIQLAIAPVFLLTGIGAILGVTTNRLSRVIDRCRVLEAGLEAGTARDADAAERELTVLSRRAVLISRAIASCTVTALLICLVIVALFATTFFHFEASLAVALLFIAAMLAFIFGLLSFLREVLLATKGHRIRLVSAAGGQR